MTKVGVELLKFDQLTNPTDTHGDHSLSRGSEGAEDPDMADFALPYKVPEPVSWCVGGLPV